MDKSKLFENKDGTTTRGVRSRLVVQEVKKAKPLRDRLDPSEVFSCMPPVEGVKALLSDWCISPFLPNGDPRVMSSS